MEAEVAVEVRGAGLADRIDYHRSLGIVGAKVRSLHRHFADHVGIGVDRRVGSIARVCDVLPVRVERDASVATVESIDVAAAQSANAVADGAVYATTPPVKFGEFVPPAEVMVKPGSILSNSVELRPTNVSFSSSLELICTSLAPESVISIWSLSAVTSTVMFWEPTFRQC